MDPSQLPNKLEELVHWLHYENRTIAIVDRVTARVSFLFYTALAVRHIGGQITPWMWALWIATISFYAGSVVAGSGVRVDDGVRLWTLSHAAFHVCVAVGQYVIVSRVHRGLVMRSRGHLDMLSNRKSLPS